MRALEGPLGSRSELNVVRVEESCLLGNAQHSHTTLVEEKHIGYIVPFFSIVKYYVV